MAIDRTGDDRFLREVVAGSSLGVLVVDSAGAVAYSDGTAGELLGSEAGELRGRRVEELCDERSVAVIRGALEESRDQPVPVDISFRGTGESRVTCTAESVAFEGEEYALLWLYEATTERRLGFGHGSEPESTERSGVGSETGDGDGTYLDGLTSASCDLSTAETVEEVAETGLRAAERLLGIDVGCIRLFDETTDELEPAVMTDAARELVAARTAFDLDATLAGRAFRTGEPVLDRVTAGADRRVSLHAPLGEQGTLTVFEPLDGDVTDARVAVIEKLASLVAANLRRAADTGGDSPTGEPVEKRAQKLRRIIDTTVEAALGDGTRKTIGATICEQLADMERFEAAWLLETDVDGEWRTVEASAGDTADAPDIVRERSQEEDVVTRAIETGETSVLCSQQAIHTSPGSEPRNGDRSVKTTVVVPLTYENRSRTYGVLVVRTPSELPPDSPVHSELRVLRDVVWLAIYSARKERLLLSEEVLELEFEVTDPGCLAVRVSAEADCSCEIEHSTVTNDGNHLMYLQVDGARPEEVCETTSAIDTVTDCRVVEESDGGCLLEVVRTRSGADVMMEVGASVRRATADGGVGRLVVEAPSDADVRDIVDAYTGYNSDSQLVAKREIDRSLPSGGTFDGRIEDALTERQESVLTSAYYAGYYDWPRQNTAEEVADSLGISPATLHQHLRKAEQEILRLVCEEQPTTA